MAADRIVLHGSTNLMKPIITELMALHHVLKGKDIGPHYSIPVTTFQDQFIFPPQVKLMFYQTSVEAGEPGKRVYGEITFRITNETEKSITVAKASTLAQKIKQEFVTGTVFKWEKGKIIVTYLDKAKGYDFRLRVKDEAEGRRIINKVMDVQQHSPEWEKLVIHESKALFPETPGKELIYEKSRQLPRRRPAAIITFRYAELHIWGVVDPITLIDTTGRRSSPLVPA